MGNTFGNTLHLTIFGESHGTAIGCVIDGLPAGIAIDWDKVSFEMRRRAPGSSLWQRQGRKRMNLKSFPVTLTATRKGIPCHADQKRRPALERLQPSQRCHAPGSCRLHGPCEI